MMSSHYEWDESKQQVIVVSTEVGDQQSPSPASRLKLFLLKVQVPLMHFYLAWLLFRFPATWSQSNVTHIALLSILIIEITVAVFITTTLRNKKEEICALVNETIRLLRNLQGDDKAGKTRNRLNTPLHDLRHLS
jgi:hypothetical protein